MDVHTWYHVVDLDEDVLFIHEDEIGVEITYTSVIFARVPARSLIL